jgi:hypothetical protein
MDIQGFQIKMGNKSSNLHVAHVHTCVNYEFISHELIINLKWIKS